MTEYQAKNFHNRAQILKETLYYKLLKMQKEIFSTDFYPALYQACQVKQAKKPKSAVDSDKQCIKVLNVQLKNKAVVMNL